jgi:hypothetical protein
MCSRVRGIRPRSRRYHAAHSAAWLGVVLDHVERGFALGRAVGLGHAGIDDEPIAVLHHQVPHVAELRLLTGTFAEQPGIGIGGRAMRFILALLAMELALGIAPAALVIALSERRSAAVRASRTWDVGMA